MRATAVALAQVLRGGARGARHGGGDTRAAALRGRRLARRRRRLPALPV